MKQANRERISITDARKQIMDSFNELVTELEITGGGKTLLLELGEALMAEVPALLVRLRHSLQNSDLFNSRLVVSELRGLLASVGAAIAVNAVTQLEAYASADDFEGALSQMEVIEQYYEILSDELGQWIARNR